MIERTAMTENLICRERKTALTSITVSSPLPGYTHGSSSIIDRKSYGNRLRNEGLKADLAFTTVFKD